MPLSSRPVKYLVSLGAFFNPFMRCRNLRAKISHGLCECIIRETEEEMWDGNREINIEKMDHGRCG